MLGLAARTIQALVAIVAGVLILGCLVGIGFAIRRLVGSNAEAVNIVSAVRTVAGFLFAALLLLFVFLIAIEVNPPGVLAALLVGAMFAMMAGVFAGIMVGPIQSALESHRTKHPPSGPMS